LFNEYFTPLIENKQNVQQVISISSLSVILIM